MCGSLVCALALTLVACDETPEPTSSPRHARERGTGASETSHDDPHAGLAPHAGLDHAPLAGPPEAPQALGGVVRETMNAGGYTYLRIEPPGAEPVWVAAIEMRVAVGDEVRVEGGNELRDFHSRTLDRTFERIVFAGSARVVGDETDPPAPSEQPLPPGHPPTGGAEPSPSHESAAPGGVRGVVRETMSSGGYTYLRVERAAGASVWIAVPAMTVAVGDEVEATAGAEMPGFHSRTLDRTFEQITFSPGARVLSHAEP